MAILVPRRLEMMNTRQRKKKLMKGKMRQKQQEMEKKLMWNMLPRKKKTKMKKMESMKMMREGEKVCNGRYERFHSERNSRGEKILTFSSSPQSKLFATQLLFDMYQYLSEERCVVSELHLR
jgi:hypothetical protein